MSNLPLLSIVYAISLWLGAYLLRRDRYRREMRFAGIGLIAYAGGLLVAAVAPNFAAYPVLAVIPSLCWAAALISVWQSRPDLEKIKPSRKRRLLVVSTIFFVLGVTLLIVPQTILSQDIALVLIGLDLMTLGYLIAALSAQEEGESLLPDALRSFAVAALWTVFVGGQILLVMRFAGVNSSLILLLFGVITAVITLQAASDAINRWLDWAILRRSRYAHDKFAADLPSAERAELRAVYNAIPRRDARVQVATLSEADFIRLTRRALSHLGDLERLAASPLIYLPLIDARLAEQSLSDNTLNRVRELKAMLIERVERLKPESGDQGVSEEWRYFNVIYYPYVVGMKPYRVNGVDADDQTPNAVGEWFRTQVPERTLHNWQNKAAQIIARDLRESA